MRHQQILVTASALALLAALSTPSLSQSPGGPGAAQDQQKTTPGATEGGRGGDAQQKGARDQPARDGRSVQRGADPAPKATDRADEKASPKSRAQGHETTPKAPQRAEDKSSPNRAVEGRKAGDDERRGKRADREKDKDKDTPRQSDKGLSKDRDRAADDRTLKSKDDRARSDKGERERSKDATQQSDRDPARDRAADDPATKNAREGRDRADRADRDRGSADRVQLSEEKRTSIRERMSKGRQGDRVTNVDFDIRVGATVPRNVTLHVLPPEVVEVVPEYREYRYVYVRDEIVIIHPTTHEVVAVIDGDRRTGARSGGHITLSADDRVYIRRSVDLGAEVRAGIGAVSVGMDLPETVEIRPLPEVVVERYPDLRDHSYFVYEDDVVIVEPRSREVALVIED